MKTTSDFRGVNDLAARSLLAFNELCDNGKVDDESISKVAAEYRNEVESLSRREQEALAKEMIDQYFDGLKRKVDKVIKIPRVPVGQKEHGPKGFKRTPSLLTTTRSTEEIQQHIKLMKMYLLCIELIFSAELQRFSHRIFTLLKEKGLYRHQMKRYANALKDATDRLQRLSNITNRELVTEQAEMVSARKLYAADYYEDGGDFINRLSAGFHRMFEVELKRLRMDNKWIAEQMNLNYPDLMAEIFTLQALASTDIELLAHCQKNIMNFGRGKIRDKGVRGSHSEPLLNAAKALADQFVDRNVDIPSEPAMLMRKHKKEFHQRLTSPEMFDLFNGQFLALKMDFVEYYFARLRMEQEEGKVNMAAIREVWYRLGSKEKVRQMFKELKRIPMLEDEEAEALDLAKSIAMSEKKQEAMNSFRSLCVNDERILPPEEPKEVWQYRVLRIVARKSNGIIPNEILASLMQAHGTKKALMEELKKAGFELKPTLNKVRKMKASELKQIA